MMQVEEKPDVTYSDVGGCKEQIEKLREVVELPLLHVTRKEIKNTWKIYSLYFSRKNSLTWVLNHQKVFYYTDHQVLEKHYVQERLRIGK